MNCSSSKKIAMSLAGFLSRVLFAAVLPSSMASAACFYDAVCLERPVPIDPNAGYRAPVPAEQLARSNFIGWDVVASFRVDVYVSPATRLCAAVISNNDRRGANRK